MENMRILIAEDDSTVAHALQDEIESLGHAAVGIARTGTEAVRLSRELRPDAIIMDIKMPELDGLAATRQVLEQAPTPIIILTGHLDPELIEDASTAGAMAYLAKPVAPGELEAALQVARRRFAETQELRSEVANLQEALRVRKVVERAKGIIMRRLNLSEAEAFRRLQKHARDQNRKLGDIAQGIVDADQMI
jgi:response regulator NasT